ncbi:hypothetical protein MMC10_005649 [Thelotrema lepadinum]|nr:hypothetical protein [Thelotrema lepadinum]
MLSTVTVAQYLFTRLRQCGVKSVHGVPGDYNLTLLDHLAHQDLHWVGNCNELNAGYATDGYSKIKGLGAVITTFGVGELSLANAIAGSYAELVPIVHIVGTPARGLQESRALVHHTLKDGDFRHFAQMYAHITVAQANLWDPRICPSLIDLTIQQCLINNRPVYIEVPTDMVSVAVSAERLESGLELPSPVIVNGEASAIEFVQERMHASKRPMILVDGECKADDAVNEIHELIKLTQWPTWTTVFGKSLVDESLSNFHGIWKGNRASAEDRSFVSSCDLILCFGPHFSDTNTYTYSSIPDPKVTIHFTSTSTAAPDHTFRDLPIKRFLSVLLKRLDLSKIKPFSHCIIQDHPKEKQQQDLESPVTQDKFYSRLSSFFRPGDIILAETGTAGHGCRDFRLPPRTILFKPSTWLSIGYMLPAAQGAALAQRELHSLGKWQQDHPEQSPRTILLIGDGSFQMTVQELSTIIREELNVLVILINNSGYTIERCLHGRSQGYNDVASWRYLLAPAFFGAGDDDRGARYPVRTAPVKTWGDLQKVLAHESEMKSPALSMVEVIMDKEDAPLSLLASLQQQKDEEGKEN